MRCNAILNCLGLKRNSLNLPLLRLVLHFLPAGVQEIHPNSKPFRACSGKHS